MAFCSSGAYFGTAVALPLCSEIMHRWGWRAVFYGLGGASLVWLIPFTLFVYDLPGDLPGISAAELVLIRGVTRGAAERSGASATFAAAAPAALHAVVGENSAMADSDSEDDVAALRRARRPRAAVLPLSMLNGAKRDARILCLMLTRPALWATTVAACAYSWMFYTLLTELPSYFTAVLHVSVREANIASILPWAVIFATTTLGGQVCDALIRRGVLTTRNARRAFALAGLLPAAALLVATAHVRDNNAVAIAMMSTAMGCLGLAISSWSVNCLDIGGAYAGVAYAFVNTVSNIMGAIAPLVCGVFTDALGDAEGYTAVFCLSAGLNVLGAFVFVVFVSVESVEQRVDAADALRAKIAQQRDDVNECQRLSTDDRYA
jgi:sugar phosphate permease